LKAREVVGLERSKFSQLNVTLTDTKMAFAR